MTGPCDRNLTERMLREHITDITEIIRTQFPALYRNLMEAPLTHPEQTSQPDTTDLCNHLDMLHHQLNTCEENRKGSGNRQGS